MTPRRSGAITGGHDRAMADEPQAPPVVGPGAPGFDPFEPVPGNCNSRKTDGSGLCRHEAGWRTDHLGFGQCRFHAGCTPAGAAHGQRLREEHQLGPLLEAERAKIGEHPDAFAGMLELVRYGWAWCRMLERRVDELDETAQDLHAPDAHGDQRPHVLVGMLMEARREHRRNCEAAIRAGIAERMVALAEDQAEAMAALIRGVLADLGHDLEQPETAAIVRRHLRALPSAS